MERAVRFALVGPGRAGTAVAEALSRAGWSCTAVAGSAPDRPSVAGAARRFRARAAGVGAVGEGADAVIVATPDASVPSASAALAPSLEPGALVVHLAGSAGLEAFDRLAAVRPDVRLAAVHPLQTLPGEVDDPGRLEGAWFAVEAGGSPAAGAAREPAGDVAASPPVAGDPGADDDDATAGAVSADDLVAGVGGHPFRVRDRRLYHAAAVVASNHLVALVGQLERLAEAAGAPPEAFVPLARASLENAFALGAAPALTGPVARGDAATVARHLEALPADELDGYRALAAEALRLSGLDDPELETILARPAPAESQERPEAGHRREAGERSEREVAR